MVVKTEVVFRLDMNTEQHVKSTDLLLQLGARVLCGVDTAEVLQQLNNACNHLQLLDGPQAPLWADKKSLWGSSKMALLSKLLASLALAGSSVVICSHSARMLDILQAHCVARKYKYSRVDSSTQQLVGQSATRTKELATFSAAKSSKFVFLLQTNAGGLDLISIPTADVVVLYDYLCNPDLDEQAVDCMRCGSQKEKLQVIRLCTANSIEEAVLEMAYKQLRLETLSAAKGQLHVCKPGQYLASLLLYQMNAFMILRPAGCGSLDVEKAKAAEYSTGLSSQMLTYHRRAADFVARGEAANDFIDRTEVQVHAYQMALEFIARELKTGGTVDVVDLKQRLEALPEGCWPLVPKGLMDAHVYALTAQQKVEAQRLHIIINFCRQPAKE